MKISNQLAFRPSFKAFSSKGKRIKKTINKQLSSEMTMVNEVLTNPEELKIFVKFIISLVKDKTKSNPVVGKNLLKLFEHDNLPSAKQTQKLITQINKEMYNIIKNDLMLLKSNQLYFYLENFYPLNILKKFFKPVQKITKKEIDEKKTELSQKLLDCVSLKMVLIPLKKILKEREKLLKPQKSSKK